MLVYADTSALVKLVLEEAETDALANWIDEHQTRVLTCDLSSTELMRAVRRSNPDRAPHARELLSRCALIRLDPSLYESAGLLDPTELRSLDAIHLTAAMQLGDQLDAFLGYDDRLLRAARRFGLPTASPR